MQQTLPGTAKRARRGRTQNAVETTLKEWQRQGHLVGESFAGVRQALRVQAQAIDRQFVLGHDTAAAQMSSVLFNQLQKVAPAQAEKDEFDDFLAGLTAAES